jgi:alkylhydroperoxidase family enzyme
MARMAPLEPPYADDVQSSFDRVMPPGVAPLLLFRTLARSPRAWRKFRAGSLLDEGPLTLRCRELVILRVCARTGCEYEWGVHVTVFADAAGLDAATVQATREVPLAPDAWSDADRVLLSAVDALHERAGLSDDEYADLARHHDDDQVLEILLLCGFYRTVSYVANGLGLPLEGFAARFDQ